MVEASLILGEFGRECSTASDFWFMVSWVQGLGSIVFKVMV